jgi:hypothetical protein
MKAIILIVVPGVAAYYVLEHNSPFQLVETDPHYDEI